ncbi:MAG: NHL repeat containing protein [Candidatus Peregrinibacteria bacterium GW2011_GWC2_39_14]|nr:MAG: NHL repeat containing protein [Candidatus Peregrinibacteria bacterium GW2011_GWC2_39_14]
MILALISLFVSATINFKTKNAEAQAVDPYEYSLRFGLGWQTDQFDGIYGPAIDPDTGDIYLSVSRSGGASYYIQKYDSSGTYISKFSTSYLPRGQHIISGGYIYVPEAGDIRKYSLSGSYIGSAASSLSMAVAVAVDGSGNFYVADQNAHLVKKFNSSGTLLITLGSTAGSADGQFYYPQGVAVDSSGNLYVADTWNNRVQKFNPSGEFVTKWTLQLDINERGWANKIYIDGSDNIYVSNSSIGNVEKYDTSGTLLTTLAIGSGSITKDAGGNIYTSNLKYNSVGDTILLTLNTYGRSLDGQFYSAENLGIDSSGNVYIADTGNNRIQKFDSAGTFISKFGSSGTGDGQFNTPRDVVVDSSGNIYVLDKGNKRVQKFNSSGTYTTQWNLELDLNEYGEGESMAIDNDNNIYVYNRFLYEVEKFTSAGVKLINIGSEGTGDGQFSSYGNKITIDQNDNTLYVMSAGRIQAFNSSGTYLRQWSLSSMSVPESITAKNSYVYVGGGAWYAGNAGFYIYDSSGTYINRYWPSSGSSYGQFSFVDDITIDPSLNIYILGAGNSASENYVQKFLPIVPPTAPTSCTISNITGTSVAVNWTDNSSDEDNFTVEKSTNGTDYSVVSSTIPANIVAKGVGDLNYNTQYWLRVKATSTTNGSSTYATCSPTTTTDTTVIEPYRFDTKWGSTTSFGIAIDSSGNVYVVERNNNRVQKFDSNGTYITQWGSYGSGDGQFDSPAGIDIDSSGNVYVVDSGNYRIQKFTSTGEFITKWGTRGWTGVDGEFEMPSDIALDSSGNVYVADWGNNRIQKFTSTGEFITKWGTYGNENGQFDSTRGVAIDSSNNVYVVDDYHNRVQKFDSNGTYITQWGSTGGGNGQFYNTNSIAVDASGNVYVADREIHRIQKFDSNGTYITQWGSVGSGNGEFNSYMFGIAIDSSGNIYASGLNDNRIQKFVPNTNVAPTSTSFAATSEENSTFSWTFNDRNEADTQSSYQIQVSTSSGFEVNICDTEKTSGTISSIAYNDTSCTTPLEASQTYYARLKLWDSNDFPTEFTSGYSFTAISPSPTAPSACVTSNITSSGMTVGWTDNSNNETYFDLEKSTNGTDYETVNNLIAANTVSYDASSLSTNDQLWFRVRAKGETGNSAYATCSPVYTLADTGFTLTHSSTGSGSILISISSEGTNPSNTEYAIMIGTQYLHSDRSLYDSAEWNTKTTWDTTEMAIGLNPNETYEIKAKARNGENIETSFNTAEYQTTLATIIPSFTISDILTTSFRIPLTSDGNPAGTQYAIKNGTQYLQTNRTFGETATWQTQTEWGGGTGPTITGLTENTSYTIRLFSRNSEEIETTGPASTAYTAVDAPSNFQATAIDSTSMSFSVDQFTNDSTYLSGYFFYGYSIPEDLGGYYSFSNWNNGEFTGYQWTHSSLTPNKQFIHHIKQRNQEGTESAIVNLTACTAANTPAISASNITTTTFDVTIDKNGNPDGTYYTIRSAGMYLNGEGTLSEPERWFTADSTNTFTISGFNPGSTYLTAIQAKNCDNIGTETSTTTAYILPVSPGTPDVTPYTTSVNVNIDSGFNDDSEVLFAIQFATNESFTDAEYVQADGTLDETATWQIYNDWGGISGKLVTGLSTNTPYYIKIRVKNGGGVEATPTTTTTTTLVNTPLTPTIVSSSETITSFRLNLNTNSNALSVRYAIQSIVASKYLSETGTLTSDTAIWKTNTEWDAIDGNASNGITITGISLGNSCYTLKAKAKSTAETETEFGALSSSMCNLANTPSTPTLATMSSTSQLALTINNTSNSDTTKYAIYEPTLLKYVQSNYQLGTSAYFKTKSAWESEDGNATYLITISGLSSNTSHTFKVKAKNDLETETALSEASNAISTNPSDGGGCTTTWAYTAWSTCSAGHQTRIKSDSNGCPGVSSITEDQTCVMPCTPNWTCTSWNSCTNSSQSRTCTDSNLCGVTTDKPIEAQVCTVTCTPNYTYSDWSTCVSGNQTRTKTDSNNCSIPNVITESQTCNVIQSCAENWACTEWSTCSTSGNQIRVCTDRNICGTTISKPSETQACTPPCNELWVCTEWSECLNDSKSRSCTDRNMCGTTISKPSETSTCTSTTTDNDDTGSDTETSTGTSENDQTNQMVVTTEDLKKEIENLKKEIAIPQDALTRGEFLAYVVTDLDLQNTRKDYLETCGKNKEECLSMLNLGASATVNQSEKNSKELDVASQLGLTSVFTEKDNKELQTNAAVTRSEAIKIILIALEVIKPETCEELIIAAGSEEALMAQKTPFKDLANNVTKCWIPKVANSACEIKLIDCSKTAEFRPDSYLLKGDFNEIMKKAKAYAKQKNIKFNITTDTDKDGLTDIMETEIHGTDPKKADTDGDSLKDGEEINKYKTNALNIDTDNDTLKDGDEIKKYKTNPLKQDTDNDGFSDNIEIAANTDPLDPLDYPKDTKGVGVSDDWQTKNKIVVENGEQDTDNDGLSDKMEYQYRTDPKNPDTDGDTFTDGQEVLDMHTDPLKFNAIDSVLLAITNIAQDQIIGSSSFYVKGTAKSNTLVQIYVRNSFGREKVIASATAGASNMIDAQTDPIKDGKYLLLAKAFDSKKSEVVSSAPISIEINSSINIEPPELLSFGGITLTEEMIKSGFKITTPSMPTIRGKTEFGNEVITSWKSLLSSSALVADSPAGEFTVRPAKALEDGEHTVTVYATRKKDNVMSRALKLSFIVKNGLSSLDLSNVNKLAGNIAGFYKKDTITKIFYQTMIGIGAAGGIWLIYFLYHKYREYKVYAAKMRRKKEKLEKGEDDDEEDEEQ